MTNKNGSYVSRLQGGDIIETFHELRSYQNSRIHEEKDRFSRFHEGFFLFSRITNDIVFTISRTLFFNFTIFTNKKTAFTTSRTPLGGPHIRLPPVLFTFDTYRQNSYNVFWVLSALLHRLLHNVSTNLFYQLRCHRSKALHNSGTTTSQLWMNNHGLRQLSFLRWRKQMTATWVLEARNISCQHHQVTKI